jgi:nucleotide-binding universal stress UspA family protein
MYKRIMLPLDGSALAEQALPHAIAQAERFEAELILFMVLSPPPRHSALVGATVQKVMEATRVSALEYLERVGVNVQEHGIKIQIVTIVGHPHNQIIRYAETNQMDLIVMCTRGQSGLSRWLMGSVADRVVRGAKVPVLVVR